MCPVEAPVDEDGTEEPGVERIPGQGSQSIVFIHQTEADDLNAPNIQSKKGYGAIWCYKVRVSGLYKKQG